MAKAIKKAEETTVKVSNISPAAMKVILAKVKGAPDPGGPRSGEPFVKGPTGFEQSGDFIKFILSEGKSMSLPGNSFKITADIVKDISAGKQGL